MRCNQLHHLIKSLYSCKTAVCIYADRQTIHATDCRGPYNHTPVNNNNENVNSEDQYLNALVHHHTFFQQHMCPDQSGTQNFFETSSNWNTFMIKGKG